MRLARLVTVFSIAIVLFGFSSPTDAATLRTKHWKISTSAVGPLHLGDSLRDLKKAGYTFFPCGGRTGGHPCYFKGPIGKVMQFDVDGHRKVKQLMVGVRSGHGYAFATRGGVHVGSTVETLKSELHPTFLGDYGYGPAFAIHKGKHRWVTFFATGDESTATIYSISVSTTKKPTQGR
jgi:hypothetical protein